MSIQTLQGVWWKKVDPAEKLWIGIALVWCLVLFAMMPLWHFTGKQNPSFETYRTTALAYQAKVDASVEKNKAGADVYMLGRMWSWYPVLKFKKGETYRLHLS